MNTHGGKRKGAGRPKGQGKYGESTKAIRDPESKVKYISEIVSKGLYEIPLYTERVAAGFPSPADDYLEDKIAAGTRTGKTGLENRLDSKVIGDVGYKRYEVNAFGKRIKEISIDPGKPGKNFITTLDLDVQTMIFSLRNFFNLNIMTSSKFLPK